MKTNVSPTSIASYREEEKSGRVLSLKARVLELVKADGPLTRREIAERLGLQLSTVCGRVNELVKADLIEDIGRVECRWTGKSVHQVQVVSTDQTKREKQKEMLS